jgi:hypothetical protein
LIILTMTHIMEFVSGAAFVSVTWDVIWNLMTTTFLSNLHMVRMIYMCLYKPIRWQDSDIDGSWIFRHPGFFSHGSLPKGQNGIYCPVLFHNSTEHG